MPHDKQGVREFSLFELQCMAFNQRIVRENSKNGKLTWNYSTKLKMFSKCPKCKYIHKTVDPLLDPYDEKTSFIIRKCWNCF